MSFTTTVMLAAAVLFAATFVRSAVGFGDALVAMPPLALLLGVKTATPLVAFAASTIAVVILSRQWRSVDVRSTWRLVVSSLAGIPFGLLLLKLAPEAHVKLLLGALLAAYGLYGLVSPRLPELRGERWAYAFGFAAGVLGGAYNTNGPPVVIYGALRRWPPEHFRATLQGCFLVTGLMIVVGHGAAGLWTPLVVWLYLASLPGILLAVWLGALTNRRIPRAAFGRVVYAFVAVMGALFLIQF
ncbi:MAG TPA: sulfite exporter TauE/SafE family protein [Pyrinomonadaceae bacterium]|nr:sulfite exporter TauE/SafE family protein [Pyrinomonadaceae bacterium]